MNKKHIIFYGQFIVSTVLSVCILVLSLYTFIGVEYGVSILYMTILSYFTITTFGIHYSFKIKYRNMDNKDISYFEYWKMIRWIYFIQLIIIIFLIIYSIIATSLFVLMIALSVLPTNMIFVYKEMFLSINRLLIVNIIDINLKILQIMGIIAVLLLNLNVWYYLFFNFIFSFTIIILIELYNKYNIKKVMNKEKTFDNMLEHMKSGFLYVIGVWLMVTASNIDVLFANLDPYSLAKYSILKSIVTGFILVVMPFKSFIFLAIGKKNTAKKIFRSSFNLLLISYGVIYFGSIAVVELVLYFNIGVSITYLIGLITMPLFVIYTVYVMNDLLIRGSKVILKFGIVTMLVFLGIFIIGVNIFLITPMLIFECQFISLFVILTIYYLIYSNKKYTLIIMLTIVIGSLLNTMNVLIYKSLLLYLLFGIIMFIMLFYSFYKTKNLDLDNE